MPALDLRREMVHIWDEYQRFQDIIGEEIIWFRFDTENSQYDDVYDETGRTYLTGVRLNVLWVDQIEDPEQYNPEGGRRPQQRFRFAISARHLRERGISTQEAHGRTLDIYKRPAAAPPQYGRPKMPWFDDRLNDVVYYDKRFYAISNFQIRGRGKYDDVIIGVSALEFIPDDEAIWDLFPDNNAWGGKDYGGVPADTGLTLTPPIGEPFNLRFEIDDVVEVEGIWTFTIVSVSGDVFSYIFPDPHNLELNFVGTEISGLDPLELYEWKVVQVLGDNQTVVWYGDLIPVVGVIRPSRDIPGEYDDVEFYTSQGSPGIWTIDTGLTELVGVFSAQIVSPEGTYPLEILSSMVYSHGLIGIYLPQGTADLLTAGDPYEVVLTQTVGTRPPDTVLTGPLIIGEP